MAMAREPFETMEGHSMPGVRQLSVFLDNRVGQLLRLTQLIDVKDIRILGLSVVDSVDCSVVRLLCDDSDEATDILHEAGFAFSVAEVLVVQLPPGKRGLLSVWQRLLSSEINIAYCYPLLPATFGSAIAICVDNVEIASDTLARNRFTVLTEADLKRY